jgi:hypothetical protein
MAQRAAMAFLRPQKNAGQLAGILDFEASRAITDA